MCSVNVRVYVKGCVYVYDTVLMYNICAVCEGMCVQCVCIDSVVCVKLCMCIVGECMCAG